MEFTIPQFISGALVVSVNYSLRNLVFKTPHCADILLQ